MVIILEGEVENRISNEPYHIHSGQIIVMPSNQPHSVKALTPLKMLLIMIQE